MRRKKDTLLNKNAESTTYYIPIIACSIFVVSEILAVIQIFYDYGFREVHGKAKINLQSMLDTIGLCLLLITAIISVAIAASKYNDVKKQQLEEDENSIKQLRQAKKELILPITYVTLGVIAVIGRIVFGLELTGNIAVGKTDSGIFP